MEEIKNVEMVEAVEIEETENKGFINKVTTWGKKHKKGIVITTFVVCGLGLVGAIIDKLNKQESCEEDENYVEINEEETSDKIEE